jgi:hypothetical protein
VALAAPDAQRSREGSTEAFDQRLYPPTGVLRLPNGSPAVVRSPLRARRHPAREGSLGNAPSQLAIRPRDLRFVCRSHWRTLDHLLLFSAYRASA